MSIDKIKEHAELMDADAELYNKISASKPENEYQLNYVKAKMKTLRERILYSTFKIKKQIKELEKII